ncbi:MAG: lipid-A-disaccharide synthase [Pleurocapsa sp. SU_5_0]|nr:lipid-A-disaccharide synthase [Pleurocapsa sp. SU_5_0]NJR46925.1 lipid-A-disaccharide synthase [Hyellaceae cyanobacterium CSU_1_1]
MQATDIVILSNAPGEVTTWVRPVVKALARVFEDRARIRISVLLSPCPHSTGKEAAIASGYPEVDRVLPAADFWSFLLWGKTKDNWQWHQRGIVVFLGGDQFYTVAISKRLGYSSLIYTEWDARWYRFVERFAAMNQKAIAQVPKSYQYKFSLVGDLMADVALEVKSQRSPVSLVGLLVGSKPAKLFQGVPLCLAIAEKIQQQLPQTKFIIPVAPTLDLATLSNYASRQHNHLIPSLGNVTAELVYSTPGPAYLITSGGTKIELVTEFPAYQTIIDCQLCLTTVGANTAELTALRVPMIVLLPTQQLDAMRSWDGLPGILANLPGIGTVFAKVINWLVLRQGRLFAWPNIWAGTEIVPELVGKLEPETVAQLVLDYLQHPERLKIMSDRLNAVRGQTGAAQQIADIIKQEITKI